MPNINIAPRVAGRNAALAAFCAAALLFSCVEPKRTDVEKLDIEGFKLGMTLKEAKEKWAGLKVMDVKDSGMVVGYEGQLGEIHLTFASEKFGTALFRIQLVRIYPDKPDPIPVYMEFVKKYGKPDFAGRQMLSVNACWGKCYGDNKKMEFVMGVVSFPNKPFPMALTLSDQSMENENRKYFKSLLAKK
jgi:hypothetical protein